MEDGRSPRPFSRHLHRSFRRYAREQESGAEDFTGYSDSRRPVPSLPLAGLRVAGHRARAYRARVYPSLTSGFHRLCHLGSFADSHSVGGRAHYTLRRNARSALVFGAAVLSHGLLDFILHRPDLQLHPGSEAQRSWVVELVGGLDRHGSPVLWHRIGDLPQRYTCAR